VDDDGFPVYSIWESSSAYDDWYPANGDTTYKGILFEASNDEGIYNPDNEKFAVDDINSDKQYYFNHEDRKIILSTSGDSDPNKSTAKVGLIYPWALRPALISREDHFDFYDYGDDLEEWTDDDNYVYYGANAAESHFIEIILFVRINIIDSKFFIIRIINPLIIARFKQYSFVCSISISRVPIIISARRFPYTVNRKTIIIHNRL
jgi:hypothetical protein